MAKFVILIHPPTGLEKKVTQKAWKNENVKDNYKRRGWREKDISSIKKTLPEGAKLEPVKEVKKEDSKKEDSQKQGEKEIKD